jgi:hypothetical protein
MDNGYTVFLGLDVGKGEHHAVGLDPTGKRLLDRPLPNTEPKLREVFDKLTQHGRVLVVVDQPNTIGALPVAVARASGLDVAYLPGLAMRRIADLYPGAAKTDARDAFVIADAARTLPHALRRVDVGDDALAEPDVLIGFDWEKPRSAHRLSPARVRRGFRNLRPQLTCPAAVPKPSRPGPGRPAGTPNHQPAARHDVHTATSTNRQKPQRGNKKKPSSPRPRRPG